MHEHDANRFEGPLGLLVMLAFTGCSAIDAPRDTALDAEGISSGVGSAYETDDDGDLEEEEHMRLDVGVSHDHCRYVDLLFVIDNSGSMCPAQQGLAAVLPDLVDAIFDSLPAGIDIHVGLTTTSFSHGGTVQQANCAPLANENQIAEYFVTDDFVDGNGFQGRLFRHQGKPFFAANTNDPDSRGELAAWFPDAVTSIGCSGGAYEFTSAAAAYALHPANEAYNGGFLRDAGSALVIFALSDEVDVSLGGAATYRDSILNAKSACGGEECIVTAGLLGANCVPDANPPIWQFLSAFGKEPVWGSISDFDGYAAVLSGALATSIAQTCESIGPIG
jgi:hypothetical protein